LTNGYLIPRDILIFYNYFLVREDAIAFLNAGEKLALLDKLSLLPNEAQTGSKTASGEGRIWVNEEFSELLFIILKGFIVFNVKPADVIAAHDMLRQKVSKDSAITNGFFTLPCR
jgi:hypothetical protein